MAKIKPRPDKSSLAILVLAVLLVLAVSYIAYGKWQDYKQSQAVGYFKQGYDQGVRDAIVSLYGQTENCKAAAIYIGNSTRQVVDVQCIPAPAASR